MKNFSLTTIALCLFFFFSCSEEKKVEDNGMHISVNDDSMHADVQITPNGIQVKSEDGKEADVQVNQNSVSIKSKDEKNNKQQVDVKMNGNNISITNDKGEVSNVNVNKQGVSIQSSDGKEQVEIGNSGKMKVRDKNGTQVEIDMKGLLEADKKK